MKTLTLCTASLITSLSLSGVATAGEQSGAQANNPASHPQVPANFSSMDKDHDKSITMEEADNAVKGYFVSIDLNSDRRISEEEYSAFTTRYPSLVDHGEMEEAE